MKHAHLFGLCGALLLSPSLVACDDGATAEGPANSPGITLMLAQLDSCTVNENADRQFPSGSDRIVVELRGGAIAGTLVKAVDKADATASGEAVVTGIPPGDDMTMRVVACNGADTTWAGESRGVSATADAKSFPPVFLTPIGSATSVCTGNSATAPGAQNPSEGRAFAAAVGNQEDAFVFGGLSTLATRAATATDSIDRYTRLTSEFTSVGKLASPRAMALAVPLPDGKIRLVGGTAALRIAEFGQPPLWADEANAPGSASETFDPATGNSVPDSSDKIPALAALAVMPGNVVIGAGGVANGTGYSDEIVRVSASGSVSRAALTTGARAGATVVPLTDASASEQLALIWGGNVDADAANVALLVKTAAALDSAVTTLTASGVSDVPLFATGIRLVPDGSGNPRVLIAGGTTITTGTSGPEFQRDVEAARLQVVTVDTTAGTATAVDVDLGGAPNQGRFSRAAALLTRLDEGEFWWVGGFTAFKNDPICGGGNDCIQDEIVRFDVTGLDGTTPALSLMGDPLRLSVGPLGAAPVGLSDRSWLMLGGIDTITATSIAKAGALVRYHAFETDLCDPAAITPAP